MTTQATQKISQVLTLRFPKILLFLCLATAGQLTPVARAQFALFLNDGSNVQNIPVGGTATIAGDTLGVSKSATLTVSYRGSATATISAIDLTGSSQFTITPPDLPVTLSPNQSVTVGIQYLATSGSLAQSRINFSFREGQAAPASFFVDLAGRVSDLVYSYLLPGGNAIPLAEGGTLEFRQTQVNTTAQATFVIANRGSAPATVNGISWSGEAFQLTGLPLPPTTIDPGRDFRFTVQFTPTSGGLYQGSVQVEQPGRASSFQLQGTSPSFTYQMILNGVISGITPGSIITLPDTEIGETTAATIVITNSGAAAAPVSTVSLVGPAFSLSQLPILPANLPTGESLSFDLVFSPTAIGRQTARLQVDSVILEFEATALGAQLTFEFSLAGSTTKIPAGGSILFNPTPVGSSTSGQFTVRNSGSSATSIVSVGITASGTAFAAPNLPSLPVNLQPGATFTVRLEFAPAQLGASTATLQINGQNFTLSGTGTQPANLPPVSITGPEGDQPPLTQPAYQITLAEPYSLLVQGTLNLAFDSEVFLNDPAVQFSTGGRIVSFTIPANTTSAIFQNSSDQIALQTGSVAGTITLTPQFQTASGINLTPGSPPVASLRIAKAAPGITGVQLGNSTATQLTLLITGYATSRTVTTIRVSAAPVPGENIASGTLMVNAESAFRTWFQSTPSNAFGSQYTASLPISIGGSTNNGTNLIDAIQSFSVVLVNELGESAPFSLQLR